MRALLLQAFDDHNEPTSRARTPVPLRVRWLVEALALCHTVNVTDEGEGAASRCYQARSPITPPGEAISRWRLHNPLNHKSGVQASSPDEIALVTYAKAVGLELLDRTLNHITVSRPNGAKVCKECPNGKNELAKMGSDCVRPVKYPCCSCLPIDLLVSMWRQSVHPERKS